MKFEEKNSITIKDYGKCFVYFLVFENEVVYVGQTAHGISRPLSHKDKVFDEIKIIPCYEEDLNVLEDYYIVKYKPKYNVLINEYYTFKQARREIGKIFGEEVSAKTLHELTRKLGIEEKRFSHKIHIRIEDVVKIIENAYNTSIM